jgi:hypothetical protein
MRTKTFRPCDQHNLLLMPPSLHDWVNPAVVAVHNLGRLFGSGRAGRVLPGWTPTTGRATRWGTG